VFKDTSRACGPQSASGARAAFTGSGPGLEGATRHPHRAVPNKSKACQQHGRQLSGFTGAVASTSTSAVRLGVLWIVLISS
jgi:hypothetical protein